MVVSNVNFNRKFSHEYLWINLFLAWVPSCKRLIRESVQVQISIISTNICQLRNLGRNGSLAEKREARWPQSQYHQALVRMCTNQCALILRSPSSTSETNFKSSNHLYWHQELARMNLTILSLRRICHPTLWKLSWEVAWRARRDSFRDQEIMRTHWMTRRLHQNMALVLAQGKLDRKLSLQCQAQELTSFHHQSVTFQTTQCPTEIRTWSTFENDLWTEWLIDENWFLRSRRVYY